MKRNSILLALALVVGLTSTSSVRAQGFGLPINETGLPAEYESTIALYLGTFALEAAYDLQFADYQEVQLALQLNVFAIFAYLNGDVFSAAQQSLQAVNAWYGSLLIDQSAFDTALGNGQFASGDPGTSDQAAWFACWYNLYAALDFFFGFYTPL